MLCFKQRTFLMTNRREVYEEIFTELIRHHEFLSSTEEIIVQSLLMKLIYCVIKDSSMTRSCGESGQNHVMQKAMGYIQEHLTEDLRLETVAKAMALSPVYFHNLFKSATGKTLHDYIEEQRIKKAIYLLQTTNDSLTKVAYECGFSSQSYFSFAFKRRMQKTPRSYMREIYGKYEL